MDRRHLMKSVAAAPFAAAFSADAASRLSLSSSDPQIQQGYLDTPRGQLYFWTAGTGDNLVLVHQSGNSAEEYTALVPHLADRYRLIAMDLPGHGRSDDPPSEPTVDDYTQAYRRVLNHLGVRNAHVLGHHGGALTAMNLAGSEPERFDKVILSGTGGVRSPEENEAYIASLTSGDRSIRNETQFMTDTWQNYLDMMSADADPRDILKPFLANLEARLRPYWGLLVNLKWDRRPALEKLRGPVLLVQGERDSFVSGQETLLEIIPNSERLEMPGCGTFMFYDRPEACAEMIKGFLG